MNIHEARRSPTLNQRTNFRRNGVSKQGPPARGSGCCFADAIIIFYTEGGGEGGKHQTGNGFISRFLRATSGVSDFTLKTLSFVVSLFRRDVRDFRYTRRRFPWKSMEYRRFKNFTILRIRGSREGEWTSCFNAFDDCRVVRGERITRRRRVKPSPIVRHFIVSTWPRCVISRRNQADTQPVTCVSLRGSVRVRTRPRWLDGGRWDEKGQGGRE